ncbi:MAG: 5'/3'-nucleotidase SurE, partial [Spirochaetaceae bacterium]|nr:5'/3'-nucleotidase SurE [Spirochaetaceae bacterium]
MRILATNDDGYTCAGIIALVRALREAGHEVSIVAPDRERSCASHAMTLSGPVSIKQVQPYTWKCTGTPADCAFIGVSDVFEWEPDIVVSGINAGANLGVDVIFSGTVAAARQATMHGVRAIAFSLCGHRPPLHWDAAAAWAAAHLEELAALCAENILVNVNFPNKEHLPKNAVHTNLSTCRYMDKVIMHDIEIEGDDSTHCEFMFGGFTPEGQENSD